MFVVHFIDRNGKSTGAVPQDLDDFNGPDCASQHSSTARRHAQHAAARAECWVQVSRVVDGKIKPAYIVRPDGSSLAPVGMKVPEREVCKRDSDDANVQKQPCFCTRCRAERRASRPAQPKAAQAL